MSRFAMVAKTFQGLEDVLRDELIFLGAENVELGTRMVSFEGDLEMMYKANLCCRTALRILKPIEKFSAEDTDELYDIVRDIDWEKYLSLDQTFSIDSTVNSSLFTHSQFVTYRVKDGIVDHFSDKYGRRPSISVSNADVMINVHISDDRVTISLDSSGAPLSQRGYRVATTEAPINEVLAAGIIMKTGWRGDCDFADPMCGSGTFLIEAALIAANINPGIYREHFAFEKWADFDADLFEELYNDDSGEREFMFKIYGGDKDPEAVTVARKNIKSAKVEDMIQLVCKPMEEWTENSDNGVLVMNPPYGERLKPESMSDLYHAIGNSLKRNFDGWNAWIIGYKDEHFADIGLKPSVKIPLLNGSLECSLREYVLFNGRYNDFRAEGGDLGRDRAAESNGPRKMKRMSEDEWKSETRRFGNHTAHKNDKTYSKTRDRKPFREDNRDRKPFREDNRDRKPFREDNRERKPFREDSRDRKPYREDNRERKPYREDKNSRAAKTVPFKNPSLPESSATVFSDKPMVSRKKWKKRSDSED